MGQILEREIPATPERASEALVMGRGGATGDSAERAAERGRTPEDYQALWQQFYDAAVAAGRANNVARAIANERLTRQRAQDEGRELLGLGDIETYF